MAKIKHSYVPMPDALKVMDYHYTDISAAESARTQIDREVGELRNSIQDVRNSIKEIRSGLSYLNMKDGHIVADPQNNKMMVYHNGKYTEFATPSDIAPDTNAHLEGTDIVFTNDGMRYTIPCRDLVDTTNRTPGFGWDVDAELHNNWNRELTNAKATYQSGSVVVIDVPEHKDAIYAVVHAITFNTDNIIPSLLVQYIHLNDIVDDITLDEMQVQTLTIYRADQIRFVTEQESSKLFEKYVETAIEETKDKIRSLRKTLNDLRRLQRADGRRFKDEAQKRYTEKWYQLLTQRERQQAAMKQQNRGHIWPPFG